MDDLLLALLCRLETVGDIHEELFDSEVREAMDGAVFDGFIKPKPGYTLPDQFAMFIPEGDRRIRDVLEWFLPAARDMAERTGLDTFHKRLRAFQNLNVRTARQNDYNDFFGWSDPGLEKGTGRTGQNGTKLSRNLFGLQQLNQFRSWLFHERELFGTTFANTGLCPAFALLGRLQWAVGQIAVTVPQPT